MNYIDDINEKTFNTFKNLLKALLKDVSILLKEIQKAQDKTKQQELIEQLQGKLKEYEKLLEQNKEPQKTEKIDFNKQIDFKKICPDTFKEMQTTLINNMEEEINNYHEILKDIVDKMQGDYSTEQKEEIITNDLNKFDMNLSFESVVYEGNWDKGSGIKGLFATCGQSEDMERLISQYLHQEYEDCYVVDYINDNGNINYKKLIEETEIEDDILSPLMKQARDDTTTQSELKSHLAKAKAEHGSIDDYINNIESFVSEQTQNIEKDINHNQNGDFNDSPHYDTSYKWEDPRENFGKAWPDDDFDL